MDIFQVHRQVIDDYASYIRSFVSIADEELKSKVEQHLRDGHLWPEPLLAFNPSFATAGRAEHLAASGAIAAPLGDAFHEYELFEHQLRAVQLGVANKDFVVTSGTGSGKSLTYIGSIFDHLFRHGAVGGVMAVVVYPLNALINSQDDELSMVAARFSKRAGKDFPFRWAKYTGQERKEEKEQIRGNPPDILLTNYMMLELLLTRSGENEQKLRESVFSNLRYLVFDELHTYRGRQGADIAMLIRRLRAQSRNPITCIGTSATMVSGGTLADQRARVAEVATKLFGKELPPDQVVGEKLVRSFEWSGALPDKAGLAAAVQSSINEDAGLEALRNHTSSVWLENRVALEEREGELIRGRPIRFSEVVALLSGDSGVEAVRCKAHLESLLRWIARVNLAHANQKPRISVLPFKLHQFLAQTGAVYTTLESEPERRSITLSPARYVEHSEDQRRLFPNVFSRISGHAYICVRKNPESGFLEPREFRDITENDGQPNLNDGYIIVGDDVWNAAEDLPSLPDAWVERDGQNRWRPRREYRDWLPSQIFFDEAGAYSESQAKRYQGWFMPAPLLFDPTAGVFFDRQTKEGTKLMQLGYEGRSTSTTITAFSILRRLTEIGFRFEDVKLLSFTDNRQDAALQAGHFNDFFAVVHLRSGLRLALERAPHQTLTFKNLGEAIQQALNLPLLEYANRDTEPEFAHARRKYDDALQKYLVHRALYDLRRGWRVVLPNLEQCALLRVDYVQLDEVAGNQQAWAGVPVLNGFAPKKRAEVFRHVLDFFRLEFALFSENYLTDRIRGEHEKEIRERLKAPWTLDSGETLEAPNHLRYEVLSRSFRGHTRSCGPASTLGKYLRALAKTHAPELDLRGDRFTAFIRALLDKLEAADYLHSTAVTNSDNLPSKVYQLRLDNILWQLGDSETVQPDLVKLRAYKDVALKPNPFFQQLYQLDFAVLKRLRGEEHTGQLGSEQRIQREDDFRAGKTSALFCSPTMELGIDIRNLSVVHLRNAPPNPANYAQRGGRAGRSGQSALVFTYCSSYSNHDRHYFANQEKLVAGAVVPSRLDLANEELLRTHLHALLISHVGLPELRDSVLDLVDEQSNLALKSSVRDSLNVPARMRAQVRQVFRAALADSAAQAALQAEPWFTEEWMDRQLTNVASELDRALDRWRNLWRAARRLLTASTTAIESGRFNISSDEYRRHKRNQDQATRQLDQLRNQVPGTHCDRSEFYPWRYLAAEGFLPGYNFTRLPLRVWVPTSSSDGEYISRPRALALREFGPENMVYHRGQKYRVRQILVNEAENALEDAKIALPSGMFLRGEQRALERCPFSNADLSDNTNREILTDLLPMSEVRAERVERISCEEEERVRQGYDIDTYFAVDDGNLSRIRRAVVRASEGPLLNLRFIPAAQLVYLNRQWRSRRDEGFPLGLTTGEWKRERDAVPPFPPGAEAVRRVKLFTTNTADALYIEPVAALALDPDGVLTLQYALKRAIENVFQIEPSEIGVSGMGNEAQPNILLFEAAEGSLGILSQLAESVTDFRAVIQEAKRLCRFDEAKYCAPASYDDLLSYYNQRDHDRLDRFLIRDALEKLLACEVNVTSPQFADYDAHYQALCRSLDPSSSTERKFLDHLHANGLRLPDAAQRSVPGLYVQPDFFYEPDVWVFCDGTPHDRPEVQADDEAKRQSIRSRGDDVFVWHYREELAAKLATRADIFRRVK